VIIPVRFFIGAFARPGFVGDVLLAVLQNARRCPTPRRLSRCSWSLRHDRAAVVLWMG